VFGISYMVIRCRSYAALGLILWSFLQRYRPYGAVVLNVIIRWAEYLWMKKSGKLSL
jgi:hypothetical protein